MTVVLVFVVLNYSLNVFATVSSQNNPVSEEGKEHTDTVSESVEDYILTLPEAQTEKGTAAPVEMASEVETVNQTGETQENSAEMFTEGTTESTTTTFQEEISTEETTVSIEEPRESETESKNLIKESETESKSEEIETESEHTKISTENLTEEITTESMEAELHQEENYIYNVSFPASTTACLDPGNASGKGQIFSEQYLVENLGNTDVLIKIKNITITYHDTEDAYELLKDAVTDNHSMIKKLNINMIWRNEEETTEKVLNVTEGVLDEYVLLLREEAYEGSTGVFYFTGTMNANRDIDWEDNELNVRFDYEIVNAHGVESIIEDTKETQDIENETEENSAELTEATTTTEQETESIIESIEETTESESTTQIIETESTSTSAFS